MNERASFLKIHSPEVLLFFRNIQLLLLLLDFGHHVTVFCCGRLSARRSEQNFMCFLVLVVPVFPTQLSSPRLGNCLMLPPQRPGVSLTASVMSSSIVAKIDFDCQRSLKHRPKGFRVTIEIRCPLWYTAKCVLEYHGSLNTNFSDLSTVSLNHMHS